MQKVLIMGATLLGMLVMATAAQADCMQNITSRSGTAWCQSARTEIEEAYITQVLGKLHAAHEKDAAFLKALDSATHATRDSIDKRCGLLTALNPEQPSGEAACQHSAKHRWLLFLNDLLACKGGDYGVTSREMMQCADTARQTLESQIAADQAKIESGIGTGEDWKKLRALVQGIEQRQ